MKSCFLLAWQWLSWVRLYRDDLQIFCKYSINISKYSLKVLPGYGGGDAVSVQGGGGGQEEAEVGQHEHGDREVEVQPVRGGRQETLAVVY